MDYVLVLFEGQGIDVIPRELLEAEAGEFQVKSNVLSLYHLGLTFGSSS